MARDVFAREHRCRYCDRPAVVVWQEDLLTCDREVCKSLADAQVRHELHVVREEDVSGRGSGARPRSRRRAAARS